MTPDIASQILNLRVKDSVYVKKSFYSLDLSTPENVVSFLTLLPVAADDLIQQACQEVFPGYVVDNFDVVLARMELQGYLTDYLDNFAGADSEDTATE